MLDTLATVAKGAGSIGTIEVIDQIPPINEKIEIFKVIIQFVVGLFTILSLRKSKKQ